METTNSKVLCHLPLYKQKNDVKSVVWRAIAGTQSSEFPKGVPSLLIGINIDHTLNLWSPSLVMITFSYKCNCL